MDISKFLFVTLALSLLGGCDKQEKQTQNQVERKAAAKERFERWAFIAKEKQIAPGETVRLVIIPGEHGFELDDTKCLIYTHLEFRQSNMICPDADKYQIAE